jgi:hypothetical protein
MRRGPYDPSSPIETQPGKAVRVVQYQGRDLFCVEQALAHGDNYSYTCDFASFYNEPAKNGSKLETAKVTLATMPYRGDHTLYCFASDGGHGTTGFTCDFERFYRDYPGQLPPPR